MKDTNPEMRPRGNGPQRDRQREIITAARIVNIPGQFATEFLTALAYAVSEHTAGTSVQCRVVHWPSGVLAVVFADPDDKEAWDAAVLDAYEQSAGQGLFSRVRAAIDAFMRADATEERETV